MKEHATKQMETSIFPSSQSSSCDLLLFPQISHTSGEAGLGSYHEYPDISISLNWFKSKFCCC